MYIEIECLNKKKEFLMALLDYYLCADNKIQVQINKGIHLIDKCRMFFKYKGKFVWNGLIPVANYYFNVDSVYIGFLKNVLMKENLKWNIIDQSKNICLAFNYHDSNKPLLEIHTTTELEKLIVFLNNMKKVGLITNYEIIKDDSG
jgi:hypothetical protein